jgi:hypothetical protein
VPDGSLTNGAVASARRFARHFEDILAAVSQSPSHVGGVGLRPHHAGGERIQLIPRDLHKVQHTDLSVYPLAE